VVSSNNASVVQLKLVNNVQRIRHKAQFDAVLKAPPCVKTPHFALHLVERNSAPEGLFPQEAAWLGVMLPKRWARRAVTRNTLRRQIYAVSCDLANLMPQAAMVVRLRSGFAKDQFISAASDALKRVARAELLHLLGPGLTDRSTKGRHA
jgi:ribonuclease P protein component